MIKPYAGRNPFGIRVGLYLNLLAVARNDVSSLWSVRALEGVDKGKKVGEGDTATLTDVGAYVRTATRDRLVARKAEPGTGKGDKGFREVHAWLTGYLLPDDVVMPDAGSRRVTYHPFERGDFFYVDTGETFTHADRATFDVDKRVYLV